MSVEHGKFGRIFQLSKAYFCSSNWVFNGFATYNQAFVMLQNHSVVFFVCISSGFIKADKSHPDDTHKIGGESLETRI